MKGGVASLIAGAAAAAQVDPEANGDVIVTVVMHHDTTGVGTKFFSSRMRGGSTPEFAGNQPTSRYNSFMAGPGPGR